MTKPTPLLQVPVPLIVRIPAIDGAGKATQLASVIVCRPKTKHAKRLVAMFGPEILKGLIQEAGEGAGQNVDGRKLLKDLAETLLSPERLAVLTEIVADMCGITADSADELDLADLWEVGKAVLGFFPALQSFALSNLPPTSPLLSAGDRPSWTRSPGAISLPTTPKSPA